MAEREFIGGKLMDKMDEINCNEMANLLSNHTEEERAYILYKSGIEVSELLTVALRKSHLLEKKRSVDRMNERRLEERLGEYEMLDCYSNPGIDIGSSNN